MRVEYLPIQGRKICARLFLRQTQDEHIYRGQTLVCVHGGPGLNSAQELLAIDSIGIPRGPFRPEKLFEKFCGVHQVIFYDQLGCGDSDQPSDSDHYSLDYYVSELEEILKWTADVTCQTSIYLLGYSWGGQIVLELLLDRQITLSADRGTPLLGQHKIPVHGAIISNSPLCEDTYAQRQQRLHDESVAHLDEETRQAIEAMHAADAQADTVGALVYRALIGDSERRITGRMAGWTAVPRMPSRLLSMPCLFVVGEHDNVPPEEFGPAAAGLPRAAVAVIAGADHAPFYGSTSDAYFAALGGFLGGAPAEA